MTTDTDHFSFTRDMALPPARMWHLMTDAKMREAWGAPGDEVLITISADTRIGGVERHRCGSEAEPEFEVETRWFHMNEPGDAVFTEQIEAGGAILGASLVTYRIEPKGTGSTVSITVSVSSFVGPEMIGEFKDGWAGGLANLEKLVEAQSAAAQ